MPTQSSIFTPQSCRSPHPARFTDALLPHFAAILRAHNVATLLDPFAGTGKIHRLKAMVPTLTTIHAYELQPAWAAWHPDTRVGNALDLPLPDATVDAVVTSPTYGNRMADHFTATQPGGRNTYTHQHGAPLHPDNSGALQWGRAYCRFHHRAWTESLRILRPGGLFLLNIKDHIRNKKRQRVTLWHTLNLTYCHGLALIDHHRIQTPGNRFCQNADARIPYESILTFRKPLN